MSHAAPARSRKMAGAFRFISRRTVLGNGKAFVSYYCVHDTTTARLDKYVWTLVFKRYIIIKMATDLIFKVKFGLPEGTIEPGHGQTPRRSRNYVPFRQTTWCGVLLKIKLVVVRLVKNSPPWNPKVIHCSARSPTFSLIFVLIASYHLCLDLVSRLFLFRFSNYIELKRAEKIRYEKPSAITNLIEIGWSWGWITWPQSPNESTQLSSVLHATYTMFA
jgi:hypothetical protein